MREPNSGHWTTKDLPVPHNINWQELSQRSPSQCKDPAPLNDQQTPVLNTTCQTTSKTGTQPHPLAERLPKIIISSQTPQNTPLDVVLPTRKMRSSLIHQNTDTSQLHMKPTHPLNQHYQLWADTKNNRNYEPAACKQETPNTVS